jgi:hypothetical protein
MPHAPCSELSALCPSWRASPDACFHNLLLRNEDFTEPVPYALSLYHLICLRHLLLGEESFFINLLKNNSTYRALSQTDIEVWIPPLGTKAPCPMPHALSSVPCALCPAKKGRETFGTRDEPLHAPCPLPCALRPYLIL